MALYEQIKYIIKYLYKIRCETMNLYTEFYPQEVLIFNVHNFALTIDKDDERLSKVMDIKYLHLNKVKFIDCHESD